MKKIFLSIALAFVSSSMASHIYAAELGHKSSTREIPAGAQYDLGFSPDRGAQDVVLKGIVSAKKQILVAAYSFTSKPVAEALYQASQRGVKVFVVADTKANSGQYSAVTFLANKGVLVRLNGNYPIHHHKFMVIDGLHVELGSFNYSAAANKQNAENALILWNVKPLADEFGIEWKRLWDEATPVKPNY